MGGLSYIFFRRGMSLRSCAGLLYDVIKKPTVTLICGEYPFTSDSHWSFAYTHESGNRKISRGTNELRRQAWEHYRKVVEPGVHMAKLLGWSNSIAVIRKQLID